ncbi:Vacuolar protein 8 [Linum perenne]
MSAQLENSIGDVSWLLRVSAPAAANEPILCLIWEQIAILYTGSLDDRSDAAASLVSLARDNDRYGKLIIEEGGVQPLLKLVKDGKAEGQENAARAIGLLGRDPESVEHMIHAGVCSVFAKILKEGPMKVQAVVAWAVSELAARALWHLAKGNSAICRSITESRALLCFAVLLEKGSGEVQYNSAMAVMELTAVAEEDSDLRRAAFKPNAPACKAVVDQMLRIIEKADSELLIPCMKAIGNLARTFRATETRMISPLVKLLDEREAEVSREAAIALTKFARSDNYLHLDHSKGIISAGGAKHLIQLVYFGEQVVQISALVLLCYIALHVPDSEELAKAEVLTVLEWAYKQAFITQNEILDPLLPEAKSRLELYQSRGSRGFH